MTDNEKENVCYMQPRSLGQRVAIANDFVKRFRYPLPLRVDAMDNHAEKLYSAWPERLYIIDARGTILYKGKPGPFGYHPEEVENWLKSYRAPSRTAVSGSLYIPFAGMFVLIMSATIFQPPLV